MLTKEKIRQFVDILKEELVPAMGCTEPISIAYAVAKAKSVLGETELETLAPALVARSLASARVRLVKVPVNTTVLPVKCVSFISFFSSSIITINSESSSNNTLFLGSLKKSAIS